MGFFVRLAPNKYIEWSQVVDAPVSCVMTQERCMSYMKGQEKDEQSFQKRWERLQKNGHTLLHATTPMDIISDNRAGPGETQLSLEQIIDTYTFKVENAGKWPWT